MRQFKIYHHNVPFRINFFAVIIALFVFTGTACVSAGRPAQENVSQENVKRPDSFTQLDSYPRFTNRPLIAQFDLRIPMRDGIHLSADIYHPSDKQQHPTIFSLTPYNNNRPGTASISPPGNRGTMEEAWSWVQRGYAFVYVDVRGRYDSEGEFDPWRNDSEDGSDVISWIADQAWSNGKVATIGGSYGGMNQWLIAKQANPHHVAIVPYVAPVDGFYDLARFNGVPKVDLIYTWLMGMYGRVNQPRNGWDWRGIMGELPLNRLDWVAGRDMPIWRDWMTNDSFNDYWESMQTTGHHDGFDIPSFNVTGWFDGQVLGTTKGYEGAVRTGKLSDHKLIIGPWLHRVNAQTTIGERDYGPKAIIALDSIRNAWIDHILLDEPVPDQPNVLYFLPVRNEWREANGWPIPQTRSEKLYLDSNGAANTLQGNGVLKWNGPGNGPEDQFTYDPSDPVLTVSSRTAGSRSGIPPGSMDNRVVESREDVLVFTSEVLEEGMEMTGPMKATIFMSTDVMDTDIMVKLLDVYPDGQALNISHGAVRAKYRDSYTHPEPLEPGKVYALEVTMYPASNYFEPGHRLRIEITSSNFPNFGRNLNHMDSDTGTEIRIAKTRIYHSNQHPSHILLPVIPEGVTLPWR